MEKEKQNGVIAEKEIIRIDLDDSESDSNGDNSVTNGCTTDSAEGKLPKALKEIFQTDEMKFMSNFDPELSNREKRKLNRKMNLEGSGKRNASLYDENGTLRSTGKDLCDCLSEHCPGCHFPCPKCRSCKCGIECRVNRRWMYETVENEGEKGLKKNPIQAH